MDLAVYVFRVVILPLKTEFRASDTSAAGGAFLSRFRLHCMISSPRAFWPCRWRLDGCNARISMPLCMPQRSFKAFIKVSDNGYRRSRPTNIPRSTVFGCRLEAYQVASRAFVTQSAHLSLQLK